MAVAAVNEGTSTDDESGAPTEAPPAIGLLDVALTPLEELKATVNIMLTDNVRQGTGEKKREEMDANAGERRRG